MFKSWRNKPLRNNGKQAKQSDQEPLDQPLARSGGNSTPSNSSLNIDQASLHNSIQENPRLPDAPTERNDWVSKAIPSARKGLRGLNVIATIIPGVNLINPGTHKMLYSSARKGGDNLHYGALRFESQGVLQLTAHNQPKIFRSILRNEALHNDPDVNDVVTKMSKLSNVNGYKFEIKCTRNENPITSVSCPANRPNTMIINIGRNSPQATKAALLMAHEAAYDRLPASKLNLHHWVQSDERSNALKKAMQDVAIEGAGNGSYNISHRGQTWEKKIDQLLPSIMKGKVVQALGARATFRIGIKSEVEVSETKRGYMRFRKPLSSGAPDGDLEMFKSTLLQTPIEDRLKVAQSLERIHKTEIGHDAKYNKTSIVFNPHLKDGEPTIYSNGGESNRLRLQFGPRYTPATQNSLLVAEYWVNNRRTFPTTDKKWQEENGISVTEVETRSGKGVELAITVVPQHVKEQQEQSTNNPPRLSGEEALVQPLQRTKYEKAQRATQEALSTLVENNVKLLEALQANAPLVNSGKSASSVKKGRSGNGRNR